MVTQYDHNVFEVVMFQSLKPGDLFVYYGEEDKPDGQYFMCLWNLKEPGLDNDRKQLIDCQVLGTLKLGSGKIVNLKHRSTNRLFRVKSHAPG